MKLRKPLAFLLTLALMLGITPIAGASGTVEGQSTTFQSAGTVTDEAGAVSTNKKDDIEVELISVTVTNIYNIQANPYGMTIEIPDGTGTSKDSIVTAPMRIENSSGVKIEVTATATATSKGGVELSSESTRKPLDPFDVPDPTQSDPHVFLYMQMKGWDESCQTEITTDPAVITKEGGSDPLTVYIAANNPPAPTPTVATLQIFGDTSIPILSEDGHYSWNRGCGFDVNVVLSFMPIQDEPGYTVGFDVRDYWWEEGDVLAYPVKIYIEGNSEPLPDDPPDNALTFDKGYHSSGSVLGNNIVNAKKSLTFTVKSGDAPIGDCYTIREVRIKRDGKDDEIPYEWKWNNPETPDVVEYTYTINAANVGPNEALTVIVVLDKATIK